MRQNSRTKIMSEGFTLIEMLVAIAIIGILATVVIASLSSARMKGRNARRVSDLKQLQLAVVEYYDLNSGFPSTGGVWYSSAIGDQVDNNGGNWIPGLKPKYVETLPTDPGGTKSADAACATAKAAYRYKSDGVSYKILSNCAPEGAWESSDPFYDPMRPAYAWMVCGGNTACNTW
ncbi:MAG: prepilin-type N-terminal cleavage/methylation domain-containing protein [bacterium]|nr:prepilin-type N-terminal cleavage/methylation domain-containing protein [bacterium]